MRTLLYSLLITSVSFLSACQKNEVSPTLQTDAVTVSVKNVTAFNMKEKATLSGMVHAKQSANISTRNMGNIKEIHVSIGDNVKKGTKLITIDAADLKASLEQAKAGVSKARAHFENTEKNFQRYFNLFQKNSISKKELEDMQTQLSVAKAGLEAANEAFNQVKAQLAYSEIRAPFDGVITSKNIKIGDLATPGVTLLVVENRKDLEIKTTVPESLISKIDTSEKINVQIPSLNSSYYGELKELSLSGKNSGGQYVAIIRLVDSDNQLLPGMYSKVDFQLKSNKRSSPVLIEKSALVTRGQLTGVYAVSQSNTAILRWIQTGRECGDKVEVLSGLSFGEQYITSSQSKLYNGKAITKK